MDAEQLFNKEIMKQVEEEFEQAVDEYRTAEEWTERIALAEAQLYHIWLEEWVQLEKN